MELILKSWYVACAIFCLYSLNTLVRERYEVKILSSNESETDPLIYSVCKELISFQLKKTEILLEDLRDDLVDYFNSSKYPKNRESQLKQVRNHLETGQYLIFNSFLCFLSKEKNELFPISNIISISNLISKPAFLAFKNSTLDFAPMTSLSIYKSFDQLIVQMKGPPYSNCSEDNGRFLCLKKCFKKKFRLSRYFYEGNETGLIYLSSSTNQTIKESEKNCFRECWRENCKIVQLFPFDEYRDSSINKLEAHPKLSEFEFWVQFIGLICSFANTSLKQLTSIAIQFASSKVKRRRVRIGLICLKWAILFLSLAYCGYLYTTMTLEQKAEERNPQRKEITRNLVKQKTVRLAICVDIKTDLLKKTMSKIEKATDGILKDHLKGIHLNYQGRLFRVDYTTEPKVLFFKTLKNTVGVQRCFILLINPDYQLMPSNPKLTIRFKKPILYIKFYLLTKKEDLNEDTFEHKATRAFKKRVVRRLESGGCISYRGLYKSCTSRRHCVERCINREALDKFKKIPIEKAVVDKKQFSRTEWNTTYPMDNPLRGPNLERYKNLSEECEKKFLDEPICVEVKFKETVGIKRPDFLVRIREIELFLDFELSIEEFSWFKHLLNLMNIQSIFFGMTVLKLLRMLYNFFKPKLRVRNDKIAPFLIYLLCSIGFTYHTYRILDLITNEELAYNPTYEVATPVRMPILVFCFQIDEKLDKNHQLTGNYLEQLTSGMTPKSVFKSILYLNGSNEWIPFNLSLVEPFFFLHLKCFRIKTYTEYDRMQLHFSISSQIVKVLKVNFADWFMYRKKSKDVFFMTKTNETIEFSNVVGFNPKGQWGMNSKYSAKQSELTVKYEDHLSFIRRFLSISYEDDFDDLDGQLPELNSSEYNFKGLKVPVEKEDFDFELQDDLFEQLSIQTNNEKTQSFLNNLDLQQTFVFNHLKEVLDSESDSDFTFSLVSIMKTQSAKNEAKLILGLLNVLFWFDLGILDLYPIFIYFYVYLLVWLPLYLLDKITQFIFFTHRWLKKFEAPLYKRLDSRKQIPRQTPQV